jgi:glycosyltransferase involved in cell wall biosynthesis
MNLPQNNKITGLVITYNEEKNIEEVIRNLNFVDEIIIVDSNSTDDTINIINKYSHVKLIINKFENFSNQRNLAIQNASNPWILFLDADERITPELKKEILETVKKPNPKSAYFFYRKFMFQNTPLLFSGWQTDKNIRLFQKEKAVYISDKLVHEKLDVTGEIGVLKNKLIHFSYSDYDSYKLKMQYYGRLKARELYEKGAKPTLFHFIIKPLYKFIHSFIIRLGFIDRKRGLIICYLNAYSIYFRYKELKKLYQNNK